jgi:hypothetical protein
MMTAAQPQTDEHRRKGRVDSIIDTLAGGMGNSITFLAEHGILFVFFALLWLAFAIALVMSQGSVDSAWEWIRSQHVVLQAVVWLLFLPVVAGMWIWETTWPLVLRLVLVIGLAGWNLIIFLPKAGEG